MQTVPIPEPAPERVRRFDLQANAWRWWLVDSGQWADDDPTYDPYRVVVLVTEDLTAKGFTGPYTGRQFGHAATLAAALLAALGVTPAVDGDHGYPHVEEGLALLEVLRAASRAGGAR